MAQFKTEGENNLASSLELFENQGSKAEHELLVKLLRWTINSMRGASLVYFFSLCLFKCFLKELGSEHANSHWLHLFDFSPLWIFKCVFKALA